MSSVLGTGVTAHEALPMALYCFLRHPASYADVIHQAVFIGGDTDTIASMAGNLAGAWLGADRIRHDLGDWLARLERREDLESLGIGLAGLAAEA
jgi:poly(ADP-ribose) glycohydrolase ARH3